MSVATLPSAGVVPSSFDRRTFVRRHPNGVCRVECRKEMLGLGQNLAKALVDLSTHGAGLVLVTELAPGQVVGVCFVTTHGRPLRVRGEVVWTVRREDGSYRAGVEFFEPLRLADVLRLVA
jgi:hypothetical protein